MNGAQQFSLPKSPLTDEQYQQMLSWYQSRDNLYEMIARMERTGAFNQDTIDKMRNQLDDSVTKVGAVLREFADLHAR